MMEAKPASGHGTFDPNWLNVQLLNLFVVALRKWRAYF